MIIQGIHSLRILLLQLLLFPATMIAQEKADAVLKAAVSYHDSQNEWSTLEAKLTFKETRPEGPDRFTILTVNNAQGKMMINRNDEDIYQVEDDHAQVLKGKGDEARALVLRNYYLYLWGLPMKLYDESTPQITYVGIERIEGLDVDVLRVPYEEDVWYFYFEQKSGKMIQYKFYKDEEAGKGELITLDGEIAVNGMKIPQSRSWYTLPEMKYLGTDILSTVD